MKAYLLVVHRKESYEGEFGPEILAVVDEYTMDENPHWWAAEVLRRKRMFGPDANAFAEIVIDLPVSDLMDALYPTRNVPVTVVGSTALPVEGNA